MKWENLMRLQVDRDWWGKHYIIPFKITKDTKLHWFQYRLINRILATNSYLKKIGYIQSDLCTFCSQDKETILHLFSECQFSRNVWRNLKIWMSNVLHENINIETIDILFCNAGMSNIQNMIILLVKFYIYQQRMKKSLPDFNGFTEYLKKYQKTEKLIYYNKNEYMKFIDRWNPFILIE